MLAVTYLCEKHCLFKVLIEIVFLKDILGGCMSVNNINSDTSQTSRTSFHALPVDHKLIFSLFKRMSALQCSCRQNMCKYSLGHFLLCCQELDHIGIWVSVGCIVAWVSLHCLIYNVCCVRCC